MSHLGCVVPVSLRRIAVVVSGWLLTVTIVSCLAWLAITSAGHRVGLNTDTVVQIDGQASDGDHRPGATGRSDRDPSRTRSLDPSGAAGGATPSATSGPVTGSSGQSASRKVERRPGLVPTGEPLPGSAALADPPGSAESPGSAGASPVGEPRQAPGRPAGQWGGPVPGLPRVTSATTAAGATSPAGDVVQITRTAQPPSTAPDVPATGPAGSAGLQSGTFAAPGGQVLLTCSAAGIVDWRVLPEPGWAVTGNLQPPDVLVVTFTQGSAVPQGPGIAQGSGSVLARAWCTAGAPAFGGAGPAPDGTAGSVPPTSAATLPAPTTTSPAAATSGTTPTSIG